ncbi:hypothetical protein CANMA_004335 [Candida margitis]|uniref:uncharacterized protein n=1 Tax=Candida margitis TaxID=1775924 RepID=UPI0022279F16|nr:uncharacterized protein CANMA_004335 [Candida margitis]KAI5957903.1 hypothetical protein CANMA_004335 [Candida margitis]
MNVLQLLPFVILPLLCLLNVIQALAITINDVKIEDPALVVKSKFKKYLPALQNSLEIPIRPNQQTIRESFIRPQGGGSIGGASHIKQHGIKSFFKKAKSHSSISSTLSSSSSSMAPQPTNADGTDINDDQDFILNQVDNDSFIFNTSDTSTVHSRPSWIKSFLNYKAKQTMLHSMSINHNHIPFSRKSNNHSPHSSNQNSDSKLKSKITEYEDSLSNPNDIKRWVRLIADKPKAASNNNDGSSTGSAFISSSIKTKSFSNGNKSSDQIEIDIEEFINYLINEQGFNSEDLQFLRMKGLDYGLGEIEQELNKLKDQQGKPKVIKIGGEEDHNVGGGNTFKVKAVLFLASLLLSF